MFVNTNSVDGIKNLATMEENVYTLKALRDELQNCSEESSEAAIYGRKLQPPQRPNPVKCKIKTVPEKPKIDANNTMLKRSKYLLFGAVALLGVALFLFIVILFNLDFFQKPYSQSGMTGKALLVVCAFAVIALCASLIFKVVETVRYREDVRSWETVRLQINEQNEQEIIRCQNEESILIAEYNAKLDEYEKIKSVYTLKESVKSRIYELLKSKVHVIAVTAEKQLFEAYMVSNIIPVEYRRFDSVLKMNEYIESGVANSSEKAVLLYEDDIKSNNVPEHISDFTGREDTYPQMQGICDNIVKIKANIADSVSKLQPFIDNIIDKAVSFENQSVNDTVLAIEFTKNFENSSVALFSSEIINKNSEIYANYVMN